MKGKTQVFGFSWGRAQRAGTVGGLVAGLVGACTLGVGGEEVSSQKQNLVDLILLNEIKADPPGAGFHQYIELRGTAGVDLTDYYVAIFDAGGEAGFVADLGTACTGNPCQFGSNGLFVITRGGHVASAPTLQIQDSSLDFMNGQPQSVLVLHSPTNPILQGEDYVANSTLVLPEGAVVVDAIGWQPADSTGSVYGGASLPFLSGGESPDALTRFLRNNNPRSAGAWFYGELSGGATSTAYDAGRVSSNAPDDAELTPGTPNMEGAGSDLGAAGSGGMGGVDGVAGETSGGASGMGGAAGGAGEGGGGASGGDSGQPIGGMAGSTGGGTAGSTTGGRAGATSGGNAGRAGGSGRAGNSGVPPFEDDEDDGCGCRMPGQSSPNGGAFAALIAALAVVLRRRRRC